MARGSTDTTRGHTRPTPSHPCTTSSAGPQGPVQAGGSSSTLSQGRLHLPATARPRNPHQTLSMCSTRQRPRPSRKKQMSVTTQSRPRTLPPPLLRARYRTRTGQGCAMPARPGIALPRRAQREARRRYQRETTETLPHHGRAAAGAHGATRSSRSRRRPTRARA